MRQFIQGTDAAYSALEQRANGRCIRFRNEDMPPGSHPEQADVGFEIEAENRSARLYVARGVEYTGSDSQVREWLLSGQRLFGSFAELRHWIQSVLAEAYLPDSNADENGTEVATPATDMSVVRDAIRDLHRPLYLNETELLARLKRRVLGQDEALKGVSAVMVRHCARTRPARPAVLFAVGPSGVGKTRTAEVVALVLREFDPQNNGYQFLRLDMTEYQEAHRVSQLIGAPQGYVGHGEGSQLVDALRSNPKTIVLFDEIEKAHPSILRVLMNAMDAGRLSTASGGSTGREVDCRFAVFMFTSNLDAKSILDELESRQSFDERSVVDEVCRRRLNAVGIAPEIIGRIGRFLVFRPLNPETRAEIMAMAVGEVAQEYGLTVNYVEPTVIVELMKKARSTAFGVRPERYMIDDSLGGVFAHAAETQANAIVRVAGPPFTCEPAEPLGDTGATGSDDNKADNRESEPSDTGGD